MKFSNLIYTYVFCFVCTEATQFKFIKKWLHEEHLDINNQCNKLKDILTIQIKDEKIRAEYVEKITKIQKDEINENLTAYVLLSNYQNKGIYEIIDAKFKELNRVIGQIFYEFPERIRNAPTTYTFFYDALEKNELLEEFDHCRNIYHNMCNGLTRPDLPNEMDILSNIRLIVTKQIERLLNLEVKLKELNINHTSLQSNSSASNKEPVDNGKCKRKRTSSGVSNDVLKLDEINATETTQHLGFEKMKKCKISEVVIKPEMAI